MYFTCLHKQLKFSFSCVSKVTKFAALKIFTNILPKCFVNLLFFKKTFSGKHLKKS